MARQSESDRLVLSASSISTFQTCKRRYYYEKIMDMRPAEATDALAFGSAIHRGLERIFRAMMEYRNRGYDGYCKEFHEEAVNDAILAATEIDLPEQDRIKVEVLLVKYAARWLEMDMRNRTVVGTEEHNRATIRNPETGKQMRNVYVQGYCDAIVLDRDGAALSIVEHKTTSAMNDDYFEHASIDLQVYMYADIVSRCMGKDVTQVIYDVIQKPRHEMAIGETDEEFEARKAAAKCPERCKRKEAETPADFRARLNAAITEDYFHREYIQIDPDMLAEFRRELWETAHEISGCTCYSKSTCNCMKWGRCPFMDACRNHGSFDGIEDKFTSRMAREVEQ